MLEQSQEIIHEVSGSREHVWLGWCHVRCRLEHPVAILHEGHRAPTEIPENGAERFKPLDAQHHLVGCNPQAVAVDGE
jgi:hypothetical protein